MYGLHKKTPKEGRYVQIWVNKDSSGKDPVTYLGSVLESDRRGLILVGLHDGTTPLRGCDASGRFVPSKQESVRFPRPNVRIEFHSWKYVNTVPASEGQYFVYVDQSPIPMSIVASAQLTNNRIPSNNLMCLIGGTHSFYSTSFEDISNKLRKEGLVAFPEHTDAIYRDTLALLKGSTQRKLYSMLAKGFHAVQDHQATELKLCV
jgi:hypothetical protein